jgi:hypothetical protein
MLLDAGLDDLRDLFALRDLLGLGGRRLLLSLSLRDGGLIFGVGFVGADQAGDYGDADGDGSDLM